MSFADIQAWYALASGPADVDLINHIHRFDIDGISGNTPEASVCDGQPGSGDGSAWSGTYLNRHTQLAYVHSTYQSVVEPEPLLTNYLDTSLSDISSITAPAGGIPGTATLAPSAFVTDKTGQTGARVAQGQTIQFPVSNQTEQSLTLDKGALGIRFKPDTDHDAPGQPLQRFFYIGNTASPPYVTAWLQGQMLHFQVRESWETVAYAKGPWYGGLWQAGQWTDIKFTWDTHTSGDALAIFVNNQRVDTSPQPGGWDVNHLTDANLFIATDYWGNQPLSGVAADIKAGAD